MDQSNEEYGRCIKCRQISTSLICQTCNSNLKEREYGKCVSCKQIYPINEGSNYCHTCSLIFREKKYGKCAECKQINSGKNWCHTCNSNKFQQNFSNWTSGNDDIDKFIQNNQLSARSHYQLLEWIPYDRFSEIAYIAKGGFGKIYRAYWKDGYISHWDVIKHKWKRNTPNKYAALKILDRSQNLTLEFINEVTSHVKIFEDKSLNEFVRCYGISQDPSTKDYIMVMPYAKRGSLRNLLNDIKLNQKKLRHINFNLSFKISTILSDIAVGLGRIHEKSLIHRDLHIGNILNFVRTTCITDMGLCKPAYYEKLENADNTVYGVLPYMAPEVIREGHYTQASDIYSFGIVMYEIISETPPYPDINHDEYLATEICKGLRPNFNIKVPQLIVHLIKRCLDANPSNRPNARDLSRTINEWKVELNQYRNNQPELVESELIKQMIDINDNLSSTNISNLPFTHPGAIYISRPFKFNNLPEPKNSNNYYENCDNITEMIYSGELSEKNSECLECEIVN